MIPMGACAQCGTIANPTDKFCNTCGAPVNRAPAPAPQAGQAAQPAPPQQGASGQYGAPPPAQYGQFGAPVPQAPPYGQAPPQAGFGPPQGGAGAGPSRCQLGHEIAPGASYCPQGHPIALDAMQFANQPQNPGYGAPPPQAYAPPQPPGGGFGAPAPQPYGGYDPNQPPPAFGAPQQGYGAQPPQPQGGFGAPPPQQSFGPPQPQGGFGPPPPQAGFGPPAQQPSFQGAPVPPGFAPGVQQGSSPGFGGPIPTTPDAVVAPGTRVLRGFLVSFQSNGAGDFWPLQSGRLTVGRANAGDPPDIPLADATISSRHAVLVIDAASGQVQLEDTNSTNGTYVNEEHIGMNGKRELRDGDRVRFGGFTTIVKCIGRIA